MSVICEKEPNDKAKTVIPPILYVGYVCTKLSVTQLYNELTRELEKEIRIIRADFPDIEIEICKLDEVLLSSICHHANEDIGYLHESNYSNMRFKKQLKLTIRELFFQLIVKYDLSFRDLKSYQFLDVLVYTSKQYEDKEGNITFDDLIPIKLSTIMGHRFDGDLYSFSEQNISFLQLKRTNLWFFKKVTILMRYLQRKDEVFIIDYPQFFKKVNGINLVEPLSLDKLHRHAKNGECTYYNNLWPGHDENKSVHSNSIMAILSYIKFNFENLSPISTISTTKNNKMLESSTSNISSETMSNYEDYSDYSEFIKEVKFM